MMNWRLPVAIPLTVLAVLVFATMALAPEQALAQAASQPGSGLPNDIKAAASLSAAQKATVDDFLKTQAQKMGDNDPKVVMAARDAVVDAYTTGTGSGFKIYYAESANKNLASAVLDSDQKLTAINGAIALASIKEAGVAPSLEKMTGSPNPAVRYYGVKGLYDIRPALLALGGDARQKLFVAVRVRGLNDNSGAVLKLVYRLLNFTAQGPLAGVDGMALASAQNEARGMIGDLIVAHLRAIRMGVPDMLDAHVEAVKTIEALSASASDADKTKMLQALANLMANTGEAYLDASSGGKTSPALMEDLLKGIEATLVRLTNSQDSPVAQALVASGTDRGAAVKLAVNKWVGTATNEGILTPAPYNVKPPEVLPKPTTAAAAPSGS